MKITHAIIIVLTISILTSCRRGYLIENDKVYFEYWNEAVGHGRYLIEQTDAKTFQEFKLDGAHDFVFGFDKKDFCEYEPAAFVDMYGSLVSYTEDKMKKLKRWKN
jgi:hypothetical protein